LSEIFTFRKIPALHCCTGWFYFLNFFNFLNPCCHSVVNFQILASLQCFGTGGSLLRQEVRRSGGQEIRRSGGQEVRRSGGQEIRRSGGQEVRRSGGQEVMRS
jgi:hypothetical protein